MALPRFFPTRPNLINPPPRTPRTHESAALSFQLGALHGSVREAVLEDMASASLASSSRAPGQWVAVVPEACDKDRLWQGWLWLRRRWWRRRGRHTFWHGWRRRWKHGRVSPVAGGRNLRRPACHTWGCVNLCANPEAGVAPVMAQ